jgi:hypothetical protein
MNVMVSLSPIPRAHPPRSNPFLRSSSDAPPFPCITPSTVTCVMVISFMIAVPFFLGRPRRPTDTHISTRHSGRMGMRGFSLPRYRKHGSGRRGPTLMRRLPNVFPSRCEVRGSLAGQHQARLAGDATAGDIEGGAVVNRDADHREADGNVDAVLAVHSLERRVALSW